MGKDEVVAVIWARRNPEDGGSQFVMLPELTVPSGTKINKLLKMLIKGDDSKLTKEEKVRRMTLNVIDEGNMRYVMKLPGQGLDGFDELNPSKVSPMFSGIGDGRSSRVDNLNQSEKVKTGDVILLMPHGFGAFDGALMLYRGEIDQIYRRLEKKRGEEFSDNWFL